MRCIFVVRNSTATHNQHNMQSCTHYYTGRPTDFLCTCTHTTADNTFCSHTRDSTAKIPTCWNCQHDKPNACQLMAILYLVNMIKH